ncbi:MAG: excalibur calcium-binding domain-containing protein [Mycobacterium sp.]
MKNVLWMIAVAVFASGITMVGVAPAAQAAPYANCTQAKNNGDCDIPSSSDKYQSKLDRDGDGLGCEC